MTENDSADPGDVTPGSDAHEALIRRQAAAKMLAYGDRARALGIDIDDVAAGLMAAADEFAPAETVKVAESDLDLYHLGEMLGREDCPLRAVKEISDHFRLFCPVAAGAVPAVVQGWLFGQSKLWSAP